MFFNCREQGYNLLQFFSSQGLAKCIIFDNFGAFSSIEIHMRKIHNFDVVNE